MDKNSPQQFATIFGAQADKDTITTIPSAPSHGRASLIKGFPIETMTPLAAGGVPPNGADMNGILRMLSITAQSSEAGLIRAWNENYSKEIGGYPYGAMVISNGALYLSNADNNGDIPPTDGSDSTNWKNILSDAFTTASGAYLPLSGGTMTGDIKFAAAGGSTSPWETAPHLTFLLPIAGTCQIYAQLDANKKPQLVLAVPDDKGEGVFWNFKNNGTLQSPKNNTLLEAQSDTNGRVTVHNLDGVKDGQALANWEDTTNKLPLAGGTMTGNITFAATGETGGEWETAPHAVFLLPDVAGSCQIYAQTDAHKNPQMVIGVPNSYNGPKFWSFKANGKLESPAGLTLLEAENDGNGRVKIHDLDGVKDGQVLANWEDTTNKLPLAGGTMTGDINLPMGGGDTAGNTTPHLTFGFKGTNNTFQIYGQQDGNNNPQAVISVPQRGDGAVNFWAFKANGTLQSPKNNTLLETQSDGNGRVTVHNLNGVKDGQALANWEDTTNKLPLAGGTMTGDINLPMGGGDTEYNTTPHLTFGFKGTNNTFQIYGQQDGNNNPQAVISVPQRGDGAVNFWAFKANGQLKSPKNNTLLEAQGDGYGRVEVHNLDGVKDGQSLANWEDTTNKLPLAGGTMTGDITFSQNNPEQVPWYTTPSIQLPMPGFYKASAFYGQLDASLTPQVVVAVTLGTGSFGYYTFKNNGSLHLTDDSIVIGCTQPQRMIEQVYSVSAKDGDWVGFPKSFSSGDLGKVHVSVVALGDLSTTEEIEYPEAQAITGVRPQDVNQWGFHLRARFLDHKATGYEMKGTFLVRAIGPA